MKWVYIWGYQLMARSSPVAHGHQRLLKSNRGYLTMIPGALQLYARNGEFGSRYPSRSKWHHFNAWKHLVHKCSLGESRSRSNLASQTPPPGDPCLLIEHYSMISTLDWNGIHWRSQRFLLFILLSTLYTVLEYRFVTMNTINRTRKKRIGCYQSEADCKGWSEYWTSKSISLSGPDCE